MNRMKRAVFVALIAAIVVVPSAMAHFVYASGNYTKEYPNCVNGGSGISEGPPQVVVEVWTQASNGSFCLTARSMPAGYLTISRQMYHWNGSSWGLCANSGWMYNGSATSYFSNYRQWSQMPCGSGWYGNSGSSYAWYNGGWKGGGRWSGNHLF